ncbi:SOS response-associated peptidase [Alicyclobacillus fastidiosus]|uniref:Abasic site processing protein n=1 Tax=Alicyclobacillus fastidiosus TaxID=392011 RepID=A0ABV5ALI5_9BACL|nr:SOS response-associated peptidase [Alicyclobacillus fastidiosus]WEH10060.1 SOS response-associated peptidase [Alicyclobacillus fastidiosus]
MCGRFALTEDWSQIVAYFGITEYDYAIPPRYNIAPSQRIPAVITGTDGERRIGPLSWGLIPQAWRNESPKIKPINARVEGLRKNTAFRRLVERRRCLIAASGYFEWHQNTKQPHYIRVKSRPVFAFAGFYDTWKGSYGQKISTCTIITCPPNARMRHIHDRMPAILRDHQDERFWLDRRVTHLDELLTVIAPYPEDDMYWYQVDKMVGNVNNDSEKCVEELK